MLSRAVMQSRRERLRAVTEFRPGEPVSLQNLNAVLTSFAEALVHSIRSIMQFPRGQAERPPEELAALEKGFGDANRISEAPFVKLSALMFASIAMKAASGQKKAPNQGTTTDIETVSHLLPYCDAMFVDDGCRSLLMDVPQQLRPPDVAKLFSNNVREDFLTYLRGLRENISVEQLQAVRRLYGERHTEGLFGIENPSDLNRDDEDDDFEDA